MSRLVQLLAAERDPHNLSKSRIEIASVLCPRSFFETDSCKPFLWFPTFNSNPGKVSVWAFSSLLSSQSSAPSCSLVSVKFLISLPRKAYSLTSLGIDHCFFHIRPGDSVSVASEFELFVLILSGLLLPSFFFSLSFFGISFFLFVS